METPSHPSQKAVGILGALPEEVAMLTQAMEINSVHTHLGRQFC